MIYAQNTKFVNLVTPAAIATNGTATATVNCVGYRYGVVTLVLGTAAATNVDVTLTLTEGDGTSFATHADLAVTTTAPNTSTPQIFRWYLDLRKRKKNLKITYAPNADAGRTAAASIELFRAEQAPTTATGRGVTVQVLA